MKDGDLYRRHQEALSLGFNEDFEGSLTALKALMVDYPDNLDVVFDYAMTQMMLGRYEEACTNLKFILAKNPSHEKALLQAQHC